MNQTLNESPVVSSTTPQTFDGDLINTVELVPQAPVVDAEPEVAKNTGEPQEEAKTQEEAETKAKQADEDRFDKHPRFQELLARVKKAEGKAAKAEAFAEAAKTRETPKPEDIPYKDVSKMSKEQLLEWQDDDPHGYYQNALREAEYNLSKKFEEKIQGKSFEDAVATTYSEFAKQNPDFDELWDTGEIKDFMNSTPGHNAISAYYALTAGKKAEEAQKAMDDRIASAVKEAEKKAQEAYRVKRESSVLSAGPAWSGLAQSDSPELSDPKKFGGDTAVLAQRVIQRMKARGQ